MSNYSRKAKKNNEEKIKAPRCCGRHMVMNKYGLLQCRKCGRQIIPTGSALDKELNNPEPTEVTTNDNEPNTNVSGE